MRQMNTLVPDDVPDLIKKLRSDGRDYGWRSNGQLVATAVYALAQLMERYETAAGKAAEEDVEDLFRRVAHQIPAVIADGKVGWGRLSDGRPALMVNEWVIADDRNGELMAVATDGSQVGYLVRGDIEPLAEPSFDGEVRPLTPGPEEVALS